MPPDTSDELVGTATSDAGPHAATIEVSPESGARGGVARVLVHALLGAMLAGLAVVLTVALQPYVPHLTWLLVLAAVAIAAWRGGTVPGLLATLVGALGIVWLRLEPVGRFTVADVADLFWLSSYLFVALVITLALASLRRERNIIARGAASYRALTEQLRMHLARLEEEVDLRRRQERLLRRQAELIDLTYDAIFVWHPDDGERISFWNRGASMLYGFTAEEAIGRSCHELLGSRPRSDRYADMQDIERVLFREGRWEGDLVQHDRHGRRLVTESRMIVVRPQNGSDDATGRSAAKLYVLETNNDVTDRVEEEESHRATEAYYRLLSEAGRVLAGSLDFENTLRSVARLAVPALADYCVVDLLEDDDRLRRVAAAHIDAEMEAIVARTIRYFPSHLPADHPLRAAMDTGETRLIAMQDAEWRERTARNVEHRADIERLSPVSTLMVPLVARGRTLGVMSVSFAHVSSHGSGREYTPREILLVEELARRAAIAVENARLYTAERAARAGAEAASRAKSDFLATISHEIRTPINAMLGYNELLELGIPGPLTDQQRIYIERVRRSGQHLLGIIEEILDLSRVEAGAMGLRRRIGLLAKPAQAAVDLVQSHAMGRGVTVEMDCDDTIEYDGDEDRVRQVLVNLLSNAIKFSGREATVRIVCGVGAQNAEQEVRAFATVSDNGPGIPGGQLQAIFEPFVQLDSGLTRRHGGTGLGLSISRRLARLMNGDLTVKSEPGIGSAFTLWLPLPATAGVREPGLSGSTA